MSAKYTVHGRLDPIPLPSILAREVYVAQEMSLYLTAELAHSCQDDTYLWIQEKVHSHWLDFTLPQ